MSTPIVFSIDEAQRRLILLALARLAVEQHQWYNPLAAIAAKYATSPQLNDGLGLFEQLYAQCQAGSLDLRMP